MLYAIFGVLLAVSLLLIWLTFDLKKRLDGRHDGEKINSMLERMAVISEQNKTLSDQNRDLRQIMDAKLSQTHETSQKQFGQSMGLIRDVTEKLTKLDETNRQVVNFSAQLKSLEDVLKNPKQRGILGEYFLETVLKNVLPPAVYKMQYKIGKDEEGRELIVDAAIFFNDRIIPIDSKFSLDNYNKIVECTNATERERLEKTFKQDLKNRIDETAKYIQPRKNTTEFAFMFIPSEAIYYDILVKKVGETGVSAGDLIEYAGKKRVNIVSPNSFYAFLQTVIQGLKQFQIEKSTKEIIKRVQDLGTHIQKYELYMTKIGTNLSSTVGAYENARKEFHKIDKDIIKIGGEERELIEIVSVDKPKDDL